MAEVIENRYLITERNMNVLFAQMAFICPMCVDGSNVYNITLLRIINWREQKKNYDTEYSKLEECIDCAPSK